MVKSTSFMVPKGEITIECGNWEEETSAFEFAKYLEVNRIFYYGFFLVPGWTLCSSLFIIFGDISSIILSGFSFFSAFSC